MRLSVAMCTYNGGSFIREQLDSILNQKQPVDEIIICDDCSTDNTIEILQLYKQKNRFPPIKIIQNEVQLGVTRNFEKAISLCTGDIIFCSEQDDIWHLDKTQKILSYFEGYPDIRTLFLVMLN